MTDTLETTLSNLDVELRDPVSLVEGLSSSQLEQLAKDVEAYLQFEINKKGPYVGFWSSLKTIVSSERRKNEKSDRTVHKSVSEDVEKLFKGKNDDELNNIQQDIQKTISEGKRGDISYWEQMAHEVSLQRARTSVAGTHKELLQKQLALLSKLRAEAKIYRDNNTDKDSGLSKDDQSNNGGDFKFVEEGGDQLAKIEAQKGLEDSEEQVRYTLMMTCLLSTDFTRIILTRSCSSLIFHS